MQIAMKRRHALEHTPFPKIYPKKWESWCNQVAECHSLLFNIFYDSLSS